MKFINKKRVIVVGAGPAGMMAANVCSKNNAEVILIEKNNMLGKKLRITGKGRCNVTNSCNLETFMSNVPTNSKFLYGALSRFSPQDAIDFFEKNGLKLKIERGNRVFPQSDKAIDVVKVFENLVQETGCKVLNNRVKKLIVNNKKCCGVEFSGGEKILSDAVILATGGKSYPKTGSTGDGYKMAQNVGHTIVEIRPSLVPLESFNDFCKQLQGLSLKNVSVELIDKNTETVVYKDFGEMLFTHYGVSGPIILSASAHMKKDKNYYIKIDLKPALTVNQLDRRIVCDFEKFKNKNFSNSLNNLLPQKLIPVIIKLSGIPEYIKCNQITKEMRMNLINLLKNFFVEISGVRPIEEAVITSGGIKVSEVNPKTMESKLIKSLYFAGEILDVDAYTGGFNLQIAFSTGYLAGLSAGLEE